VVCIVLGSLLFYAEMPDEEPKETLVVTPPDYTVLAESLNETIQEALVGLGIHSEWISTPRIRNTESGIHSQIRVRVPANLPFALCNLEVTRAVERIGGRIIEGLENGRGTLVTLEIGMSERITSKVLLSVDESIERPEGKVALVIDDFGEADYKTSQGFFHIDQPLTIAVLPHARTSREMAVQAREKGIEVILHLPMEPHNPQINPGKEAIFVNLSPEEIQDRVRRSLADVPHARGVSNHMGSKATEDKTVMGTVLEEVRKQGLFWIDSRTSLNSVAFDQAKENGVRVAQNSMFLDSEPEVEKILAKLERMYQEATTGEQLLAIAHCRPLTLQVLREEIPKLEKRGITFVHASELVE
jgi:polysaccharide deacetylase 2 family uncharacterized protein YibQ